MLARAIALVSALLVGAAIIPPAAAAPAGSPPIPVSLTSAVSPARPEAAVSPARPEAAVSPARRESPLVPTPSGVALSVAGATSLPASNGCTHVPTGTSAALAQVAVYAVAGATSSTVRVG